MRKCNECVNFILSAWHHLSSLSLSLLVCDHNTMCSQCIFWIDLFMSKYVCGDDDSWHDRFWGVIIINDEWMTGSNHVVANFLSSHFTSLDNSRIWIMLRVYVDFIQRVKNENIREIKSEKDSWIFYVNIFLALY